MDVDACVEELRQTMIGAGLSYDVWRVYTNPPDRREYLATMNRYALFFAISIHAHFVAMLVALYRVYETRDDTYNIPALLRHVHTEKILPEPVIANLQEKYQAAKPLWKKVSILRNNAFAHKTVDPTTDEIFKKANVMPDELRDLIEATKVLLNEISHASKQDVHAFNLNARHDTIALLQDLKSIKF